MNTVPSATELQIFQQNLINWFNKNKRDLPWRNKPHWYKTYLSEIILQQTTVDQGLPYFHTFLQKYSTVSDLAAADEQDVLFLWAGLGYYARGRNMLKAAKKIVHEFNSEFPQDYKEALSIPGIGPYTASAILSIAFNLPFAVIDGNVIRVVSRLFAIRQDTRDPKTLQRIEKQADRILDKIKPGAFNEALMELGALVCKPQNPLCERCPVHNHCKAFEKSLTAKIPYKSPAAAKSKKFNLAAILIFEKHICLAQRPDKGLLGGMWEFPVLETDKKQFSENGQQTLVKNLRINGVNLDCSANYRHIYSHIDLAYRAYLFKIKTNSIRLDNYPNHKWVKFHDLEKYPIHNAHKKLLTWLGESADIKNILSL